jgi:hypothetical protein
MRSKFFKRIEIGDIIPRVGDKNSLRDNRITMANRIGEMGIFRGGGGYPYSL